MANLQEYAGQQIGEYRLLRQLGRGTFGVVYLAEHIHEHTQVAIKLLRLQLTRSLELKDFLNEARVIRLRHPHIVPILDFGLSPDDMPFLVMEFAEKGTLRDRYWHGTSLPLPDIVTYTLQLSSALQYAHDRRLIHRDVKPENMLLRGDGTVLLSDFGIAKIMEQSSTMSTHNQAGTPAYMAPEQGEGQPCPASDQYALAVVIYEWMTGKRPFAGNPLEVALQHRLNPPPSLRQLRPGIPLGAEQVILKALAKAPEARFVSITQFAQALQIAIDGSPTEKVSAVPLQPRQPFRGEQASLLSGTFASPNTSQLSQTVSRLSPLRQDQLGTFLLPATASIGQLQTMRETRTSDSLADPAVSFEQEGTRKSFPSNQMSRQAPPQSLQEVAYVRSLPPERRVFSKKWGLSLLLLICCVIGASLLAWFALLQPRLSARPAGGAVAAIHTPGGESAYDRAVATAGVMAGFNAQHSGTNPYERSLNAATVDRLVLKWTGLVSGVIASSAVVANGRVYVGSETGFLYAFDATTGHVKWTASTGSSIVDSSPAVVGGLIYVGAQNGKLYAFDATTGHVKWTATTGNSITSSPTVANGLVYVGSWDNKLYAFDATTGHFKWTASTTHPLASSPAVFANTLYIGSGDGGLYAFDATTGQLKWATSTGMTIISSPAVANGLVYVSSQNSTLYAFDAVTGHLRWTVATENSVSSSPSVANGIVYVGAQNGKVYAFDAATGHLEWSSATGSSITCAPMLADGVVYVGAQNGELYAFDATSGQQKWAASTGNSITASPVVANGRVYAGSWDNKLYVFGLA